VFYLGYALVRERADALAGGREHTDHNYVESVRGQPKTKIIGSSGLRNAEVKASRLSFPRRFM